MTGFCRTIAADWGSGRLARRDLPASVTDSVTLRWDDVAALGIRDGNPHQPPWRTKGMRQMGEPVPCLDAIHGEPLGELSGSLQFAWNHTPIPS